MEMILLEGTPITPAVKFDLKEGKFEIKGVSIAENTLEFYKPLLESLDQYAAHPNPVTELDIQLDYFNTTSSKCLLDIFKRLELIHNKGSKVNINWYYEEQDEDMREAGHDYMAIVDMVFNMKPIK